MTHQDSEKTTSALQLYAEEPMEDGDVVLLLDDTVCLEVAGLADHWDEVQRSSVAEVLRQTSSSVVVAVARRGAALTPDDYRMWRDLHADLQGTAVALSPVRALPAA